MVCPNTKLSKKYGDLYIKFNVSFDDLTEKLKGLSLDVVKEIPKPKEKFNTHDEHNTHNVQQCAQL